MVRRISVLGFSLSSPKGGEGRGEEANRFEIKIPLPAKPGESK